MIEPETAMIVPVPLPTEVTRPADETVAMPGAFGTHVTAAPGMAVPPASFTVAVSVAVAPIDAKESDVGDNSMLARTCETVTADVALAEPEVAVIVAVPAATAVTSPADETVATDAADVDHVTVAPDMADPPVSFTVALSVTVSPNDAKVVVLGETSTVDTTCPTVTADVPVAAPEVAVIVAVPSATAVTSPAADTVATVSADVAHVTVALAIVAPFWSLTVAVSCVVSPKEAKLRLVAERVIEVATGVGVGVVGVVGGAVGPVPLSPHASSKSRATTACVLVLKPLVNIRPYPTKGTNRSLSCSVSAM